MPYCLNLFLFLPSINLVSLLAFVFSLDRRLVCSYCFVMGIQKISAVYMSKPTVNDSFHLGL